MKQKQPTIRDALYEAPGPKARKRIAVATILSILVLAALVIAVIRRFAENGQLDARYWSIFTRYTTWRFLGYGLVGTMTAALTAGIITFFVGLLLMMGRISSFKVLRALCTVLIEFSTSFYLFLSACRTTVRHPASGSLEGRSPCCDFRLRCCGRSTPLRCQCRTERSDGSGTLTRHAPQQRFFQDHLPAGAALCRTGPDLRTCHRPERYDVRLYRQLLGPYAECTCPDQ